jgi:transitional endoplasmic reticulum ATPase
MDVDVSKTSRVARISALSDDGMRIWIELADGGTASVDSNDEPFEIPVGTVVLVRDEDNFLELAPDSVWPANGSGDAEAGLWVGVVKLKTDDVTVVDAGGRWRRVPTTSDVDYEQGNTVEGTDAVGVTKVLAEKPLRYIEPPDLDDDVLDKFRTAPSAELTFDDFGGLPQVVERAKELIELPLERRAQLAHIGASPVKGVLFTGPPGTGKTMLARIIACVAGATFYEISGPTVFSKWYGESEEILRQIFSDASENAPAIIFFDEIDSVAGQRNEEAHEASKRVVAQLLTLMDGFSPDKAVTVIAATNRPQDIDVALKRPGRFDWQIDFPLPSQGDREAILRVSARRLKTNGPLPHAWVAARTDGWSAAELAAIWKEAALLAVADLGREFIMLEDYLGGHERVGLQRNQVANAHEGERVA